MTSFHFEKICSRGKRRELFDIRLARRQQRRDDFASGFGDHITVRAADFAQQTVRPQQPQLAGHRTGPPPFLLVVAGFGPEMPSQVAVAQSVDRIFAPADRSQQGRVFFTPRIERAMAASIFDHGAADARAGFAGRGFVRHAGQRFQIPPVGCRRYLRPPPQLAHAALQGPPRFFPARLALFGAIDLELFGLVDRGFDAQHAAFLVIHLDRVAVDGVFDADAFGPVLEVADDFAVERRRRPPAGRRDVPAQEAHHVGAGEGAQAVMDQAGIECGQTRRVAEQQVGGILAGAGGPVIGLADGTADFPVQRMGLIEQARPARAASRCAVVRPAGPGRAGLLRPRRNSCRAGGRPGRRIHLAGEPVAPVEAEVHGEGKPGLHTHMAQAQFLVLEVMVEVEAFAGFEHQVNVFGLAVAAHGVGQTVFQRAENGDQTGGHAVVAGDLAGQVFFAGLAAGQIAEGSPGLLGTGVGGGFDARGQSLGESAEVFDEDTTGVEISFHDGRLEEMAERAAQAQPVKAGQNACHRIAKSVKKSRRDAGGGGRSLLVHHPNFYPNARSSATLVAAWPR